MANEFWNRRVRPNLRKARAVVAGTWPSIRRDALADGDHPIVGAPASDSVDYAFPSRRSRAGIAPEGLGGGLCVERQLECPAFRYWLSRMGVPTDRAHRKHWELAYVTQALWERGCLAPGRRGLGFACGEEPLPALFSELGADVVATDLDPHDRRAQAWRATSQHLSNTAPIAARLGAGSVERRSVDMNRIPADLAGFDFTWSVCSLEHCGSIDLGLAFLERQMACLRPGGVAVHTTEFNLTSNHQTIEAGDTVLFRRRDIEQVVSRLADAGHVVEPIALDPGEGSIDRHVDWPPYSPDRHLRLKLGRFAATSLGMIFRKASVTQRAMAA